MPKLSLWVLSAHLNSCGEINNLLLDFGLSGTWMAQPAIESHYQLKASARCSSADIASLVSKLSKLQAPFELETLEQLPERYLFHPGLGITRQQLNEAGELLLREDAVLSAIASARGSAKDLDRRMRLLTGTAWLDLLEVYRNHEGVRLLPRAV